MFWLICVIVFTAGLFFINIFNNKISYKLSIMLVGFNTIFLVVSFMLLLLQGFGGQGVKERLVKTARFNVYITKEMPYGYYIENDKIKEIPIYRFVDSDAVVVFKEHNYNNYVEKKTFMKPRTFFHLINEYENKYYFYGTITIKEVEVSPK